MAKGITVFDGVLLTAFTFAWLHQAGPQQVVDLEHALEHYGPTIVRNEEQGRPGDELADSVMEIVEAVVQDQKEKEEREEESGPEAPGEKTVDEHEQSAEEGELRKSQEEERNTMLAELADVREKFEAAHKEDGQLTQDENAKRLDDAEKAVMDRLEAKHAAQIEALRAQQAQELQRQQVQQVQDLSR